MFVSTSGAAAWVEVVISDATDIGVSPAKPRGVSMVRSGVCIEVPRLPFRLPGVMTCCNRRPALLIHTPSRDSRASRYSCCVSVSRRPGKKSRAIISDIAFVYVSSSIAFLGRLIRFGGGGGGISSVSIERRTRVEDL